MFSHEGRSTGIFAFGMIQRGNTCREYHGEGIFMGLDSSTGITPDFSGMFAVLTLYEC